jgi:protein subunit release factor A
MTDTVSTYLRITLFDDNGEGERFFLDVCGMLEALAQRAGVPLTLVSEQPAGSPPARTYRCDEAIPTLLLRELGCHRAQVVPATSNTGRVMTSQVSVVAFPVVPDDPQPIIKTYSYILRRVTRHQTGERLPLDQVLAGQE